MVRMSRLEHCGAHDRIALTHNERIRYTPNELAAVIRFRVRLLIVIGKAPFPVLAENFVKTLPRIEALLDAQKPPYIAEGIPAHTRGARTQSREFGLDSALVSEEVKLVGQRLLASFERETRKSQVRAVLDPSQEPHVGRMEPT
jgi:hypothetical protein